MLVVIILVILERAMILNQLAAKKLIAKQKPQKAKERVNDETKSNIETPESALKKR